MPPKKRGRPARVVEVTPVEKAVVCSITLRLADQETIGTGATMLEALSNLKKPAKMVMKGVVVLSNGTKTRTLVYTPIQVKRMFYPITQKLLAKQYSFGLV